MTESNPYRLSRNAAPSRYDLTLTPDLPAATFAGEATVALELTEASTRIQLNSVELDITSALLVGADGTEITASVALNEEAEVATLTLGSTAAAGDWTLQLRFTGILNDKLRGFYRSTFTDADGQPQTIATTQFEATDARRAFPCWDEPDFKAVFGVTLIVSDGLTALSNASVKAETVLHGGLRKVEFEDTMKMSTYLVAFIVGTFVVSDPVDVGGVPLRVAAVPGREALTPFALESGAAALSYLSDYFGIPYPGGKLDLIAIPDFAFGAMENLGCVTFRETALLVDPQRASRAEVERVADVIGHEIAHMWFGDLVTMKWWNGIWLNEAFATFMQMSFTNDFRPDWQRWVSFGVSKSAAMAVDSLSSTRPIEFEVLNPAEAQGMFDLLTYQKGGSVLRMLEQHLGEQVFRTGISHYLNSHAYGNAETTDLWDALESTSGEPVRAMMDSWILQAGHPIVTTEFDSASGQLTLSQRRFRYLPDEPNDARWHIPIAIRSSAGGRISEQKFLLSEATATITIDKDTEWLVVNAGSNGFYRVSYDSDLLASLSAHAAVLEPLERFTLATDTWALCLSDQVPLADVLTVVRALTFDDDPDVWGAALAPLRVLDKVNRPENRPALQAFVRSLATPKFSELGWDPVAGESERIGSLRGVLVAALGGLGADVGVRQEAARRYALYRNDPSALDANLVLPVEAVLAATNEAAHYDELYAKFADDASTPQGKVNALGALASFTDPDLVERTLALISGPEVRSQDEPYTIATMLTQTGSGAITWAWVEQNWDALMARLPSNSIDRMVNGLVAQLDPELGDRARAFLAEHPVPQALKSIAQTCERLEVNAAFYRAHVGEVAEIF